MRQNVRFGRNHALGLCIHGLACQQTTIGDFRCLLEIGGAGEQGADPVTSVNGEIWPSVMITMTGRMAPRA